MVLVSTGRNSVSPLLLTLRHSDPISDVDGQIQNSDAPKLFRVYRSGERGGVHGVIDNKLRRRAILEPVVGHLKTDGHVGRNYFKCRDGDQANAVPTATG